MNFAITSHARYKTPKYRICGTQLAFLLFFLLLLTLPLSANNLKQNIDAILSDPALQGGVQGVFVKSLKTGETLYEHSADTLLLPASNMKLYTSATALDALGPNFTYSTGIYTTGQLLSDGTLKGNIVVKGGGDPVLETPDLNELAAQVRKSGIKKISGGIIVDDFYFDDERLGASWEWDDLTYYYSAPIDALNLNRNVVQVYVAPGKSAGKPALVRIEPAVDCLSIDNSCVTGAAGTQESISVARKLGTDIVKIRGSVPLDKTSNNAIESVTVPDPAVYTGCVFRNALNQAGIRVNGKVARAHTPSDAKPLCSHISPPLSKIVALLNKPSDNLIAEVLLKTVGAAKKGNGSDEAGIEVEHEFFSRAGLESNCIYPADGSGLSRRDFVTARGTVKLLEYMYNHPSGKWYIDSLPIAGVDGSLRSRMKQTPAEANVKAKTGSLNRVSSISGYVNTASGEPLAFSIIMNNHSCSGGTTHNLQDKICVLLAQQQ